MSVDRGSSPMTCASKRYFSSKSAAKRARKGTQAHGGGAMEVYRCRWCGKWHIGHPYKQEATA